MKKPMLMAMVVVACASHRGELTPRELADARAAGLFIIKTPDCGAVLHTGSTAAVSKKEKPFAE